MPRLRKPKPTHVFVVPYDFYDITIGTKCFVLREFTGLNNKGMVDVRLEDGSKFDCYAYRIAPIERN